MQSKNQSINRNCATATGYTCLYCKKKRFFLLTEHFQMTTRHSYPQKNWTSQKYTKPCSIIKLEFFCCFRYVEQTLQLHSAKKIKTPTLWLPVFICKSVKWKSFDLELLYENKVFFPFSDFRMAHTVQEIWFFTVDVFISQQWASMG